jgi:acyl carrier protein
MADNVHSRIYSIFLTVLRIAPERLSDQTRRGDLEEWDSLAHLTLVEALCQEFGVSISPEEALDMETVSDIKGFISQQVGSPR